MKESLKEYWLKKPKDNELIQITKNKTFISKNTIYFSSYLSNILCNQI